MPPVLGGLREYLKYIRIVKLIVKAIKKGDMSKLESLLKDMPDDVKAKVKTMADVYNAYKEGKVSREDAVKAIAKELGFDDISLVNDLVELIDELVE